MRLTTVFFIPLLYTAHLLCGLPVQHCWWVSVQLLSSKLPYSTLEAYIIELCLCLFVGTAAAWQCKERYNAWQGHCSYGKNSSPWSLVAAEPVLQMLLTSIVCALRNGCRQRVKLLHIRKTRWLWHVCYCSKLLALTASCLIVVCSPRTCPSMLRTASHST